jgi:Calcineurin-like phosphoesterase
MSIQTQNGKLTQSVRIETPEASSQTAPQPGPPPESKRMKMVGWYDPRQLAKTGIEVAISTIFGRHSDHRLVEAMASGDKDEPFYDYTHHYVDNGHDISQPDKTKPRDSIWIDYVGDVGDGWNSTYAVAYYLAEPGRTFTYTDEATKRQHQAQTERGDILIFGGDEVYPTASREMYETRLLGPYETALRYSKAPYPHVFALPGNHDWYDSLVAFTRLFTARPWFAGWRTRQARSYFALKLPHNWWLLGTDVQLGSDIDGPQVAYFERLSKYMKEEQEKTGKPASIILCHAEPHWIRAAQYEGIDPNYSESNLRLLEKKLGKDVAVFIAGDLHHYRRHEARDKSTQKITAGGGGAFLHPTHYGIRGRNLDTIIEHELDETPEADVHLPLGFGEKKRQSEHDVSQDRIFELRGCFPSTKDSRKLTWRNLYFPYLKRNASWTFGLVTALLYLLLTLTVVARIDDLGLSSLTYQLDVITATALEAMLNSTPTLFLVTLTMVGFVFFTDTHLLTYRIVMGLLHAVVHILAAFFLALFFVSIVAHLLPRNIWRFTLPLGGVPFYFDLRMLTASLLILLGGYFVGSFIMGAYLLLSMNFFGRHGNEAFSSLAVEDWKNFLRLHINEHGNLTIYPIGLRRVPRKWKAREPGADGPELVSADPNATAPELIESPIIMKKAGTGTGVEASYTDRRLDTETTQSSAATYD